MLCYSNGTDNNMRSLVYSQNVVKACYVQIENRCVSLLRSNCNNRPLRAVKSVRATMDSMEPLLRTLPNFRIIHLIRDPRAVALSRIEFDASARGQFTNKVLLFSSPHDSPLVRQFCMFYCSIYMTCVARRTKSQKLFVYTVEITGGEENACLCSTLF